MNDGKLCVLELNLEFVRSVGQFYLWSKRGEKEERICSMIDHCIGNHVWFSNFLKVEV